jgi:hypothetical protein
MRVNIESLFTQREIRGTADVDRAAKTIHGSTTTRYFRDPIAKRSCLWICRQVPEFGDPKLPLSAIESKYADEATLNRLP